MTAVEEHPDTDTWWHTIYTENTLNTPVRHLIDSLDEIATQPIPYNWLPGRARTFYGTHFTTFGDLADETITTLTDRPKGGIGTVKAILTATREALHQARTTPRPTPPPTTSPASSTACSPASPTTTTPCSPPADGHWTRRPSQ